MKKDLDTLGLLSQVIYDKKGFNILGLDVRGVSSMTDYFLIAEGNIDRHVRAIAKEVIDVMKSEHMHLLHVDGMDGGDWVVLDYLNIIIHLFVPELRDRYRLEELWKKSRIISLNIDISHNGNPNK